MIPGLSILISWLLSQPIKLYLDLVWDLHPYNVWWMRQFFIKILHRTLPRGDQIFCLFWWLNFIMCFIVYSFPTNVCKIQYVHSHPIYSLSSHILPLWRLRWNTAVYHWVVNQVQQQTWEHAEACLVKLLKPLINQNSQSLNN